MDDYDGKDHVETEEKESENDDAEEELEQSHHLSRYRRQGIAIANQIDIESDEETDVADDTESETTDERKCLWAICDDCKKWRRQPSGLSEEDLPDKWYCYLLNTSDPQLARCSAVEELPSSDEEEVCSSDKEELPSSNEEEDQHLPLILRPELRPMTLRRSLPQSPQLRICNVDNDTQFENDHDDMDHAYFSAEKSDEEEVICEAVPQRRRSKRIRNAKDHEQGSRRSKRLRLFSAAHGSESDSANQRQLLRDTSRLMGNSLPNRVSSYSLFLVLKLLICSLTRTNLFSFRYFEFWKAENIQMFFAGPMTVNL